MRRVENSQKLILRTSPNVAMDFLKEGRRWLERDLLIIGTALFNLETAIKLGQTPRKVVIPISRESALRFDTRELKTELEDLVLNVLVRDIPIEFERAARPRARKSKFQRPEPCDTVCLFSGGVDSYSGILNSYSQYGNVVGVSVVHGDQPWGSHILDSVIARIHRDYDIRFHRLYAPPMMSRGYSQLRGFLYCLYGGIFASLHEAKRMMITEVGPTMYQPKLAPFDTVTMTTHPFVLRKVKNVLRLVLGREVQLVLPYENMTKAEVVAAAPLKDGLPLTHSCISLRFGKNEGSCYGCVIRRLGFLVAGVQDTEYTTDPIGDSDANDDNLISLLRFSYDVLMDYRSMIPSSQDVIEDYNKRDLFERFALDTYAALHLHRSERGPLNPNLTSIFNAGVDHLGLQRLEKRIAKVRRPTFKPNFDKVV